MYLDCLFDRDHSLTVDYSDRQVSLAKISSAPLSVSDCIYHPQVELYAEFGHDRLLDFLRASNYYSLEKAYQICKQRDFVPEMVFLLGRMGNNRQALMLIIERLNDVARAIEFAKEQEDEDLWEDLLRYSEDKPDFIRGLLENVGAEINPIRVIRRIKDGLEIPGLKKAVIKILQSSTLQVSLLEDCQRILHSDASGLASDLQKAQTNGAFGTGEHKSDPYLCCLWLTLAIFISKLALSRLSGLPLPPRRHHQIPSRFTVLLPTYRSCNVCAP